MSAPFANSLEHKAQQLGWTAHEFRLWLTSQGYTDADIEAAFSPASLRHIVEAPVSRLLPRAALAIERPTEKLARRVRIDVVNADDVECHVDLDRWKWKKRLRVYAGFLFFGNKVVRALANGLLAGAAPPVPRAEEEAAMLLRAFYSGHVPLRSAWAITPYKLSPQQEYVIAFLSGYLRDAAIAHELGHIAYALGGRCRQVMELREALTALRTPEWGKHWVDELAADLLAAKLLDQPTGGELASAHGLIIALLIIEMMERCRGRPAAAPSSHPPSSVRRGLLFMTFPSLARASALNTMDATCQKIFQLACADDAT